MTTGIDQALRKDIRLLGQLLGDVLRAHEGDAMYAAVEEIRQTALRFRRDGEPAAARRLDALLRRLSRDDTIDVVRAFSYFSHLANIAEDRHLVRRQQASASMRPGTLPHAMAALHARGVGPRRLSSLLADACLMPVLTAHPTEVRRKSILDAERSIAALIEAREGEPEDRARGDRRGAARGHLDPLADADAAARKAQRLRRDRQRARLLAHHVPA